MQVTEDAQPSPSSGHSRKRRDTFDQARTFPHPHDHNRKKRDITEVASEAYPRLIKVVLPGNVLCTYCSNVPV